MGKFPEPSDRWLPVLGIAIWASAVVACLPWLHEDNSAATLGPVAYRVCAVLLALIGLGAWTAARSPRRSALLPFLTILVGIIVQLVFYVGYYYRASGPGIMMLGYIPPAILFTVATPLHWAGALVRRDHPGDERLRKVGRVSARVILTGFAFTFILEALPYLVMLGQRGTGFLSGSSGSQIAYSLLRVARNILIFWAAIESLRKPGDDSIVQSRAIRIHQLMCGWIGISVLTHLFTVGRLLFVSGPGTQARVNLWHGVVYLILTLTVVCLATHGYRPAAPVGSPSP